MYPALVSCSTVIYFAEWPHDALTAVSQHFLKKYEQVNSVADLCASLHQSAKLLANRMREEFRREVHITPTNYIQFVRNFIR